MRIIVFDVPAEIGGALTILNQYHEAAIKDKDTDWIFIVSTPHLKEIDNVKVLNYPWIKKSWFHRIYFDNFVAPKIVKKYNPDEVLSLQNVSVPKVKVKQTIYLHQSLPFVEKRYKLTENFKFWVYQNIISKFIFNSIRKADKVIVQTKWIMNAAVEKTKANKEKFILKQPELNVKVTKTFKQSNDGNKLFFYPSSGFPYKNHEVIVQACKLLKEKNIGDYEVIFTLLGNENKEIKKIKNFVEKEKLPVKFIGSISIDEVYDYYSKAILLFPSYIETFGLPMLEAKMHHTPIIASDCAFSHEILDDYDKANFFDPHNATSLAILLANEMEDIKYN